MVIHRYFLKKNIPYIYVTYSQFPFEAEYHRHYSSSNIQEQSFWEIYTELFHQAIKKANVISIMESYNEVNDFFMIWNKELLTDKLKTKFGFKGIIMSDWYAIYSNENQHFTTELDMNQQGGTVELEQIPSFVKQG